MQSRKRIVMVGTRSDACGGIASVISLYQSNGLFLRRELVYLATHCQGTKREKAQLLWQACTRLVRLLLRGEVSILHVHVASNASFWRKTLFLSIAAAWGVPTVLHLHAGPFPLFYAQRCSAFAKFAVRLVFSRVDKVVVVSNALNRWVRSICTPKSILTLFNPAIVTGNKPFAPGRPREAASLLFLGNLSRAKGTYDLLHAMHSVLKQVPDAKLLLCGNGQMAETTELVRRLGLQQHVSMPGWIDAQRRAELLGSATLFVLPSYAEGLPMSILEAMASGLPVIATRVGGVPDAITHEREGLLVEAGDVELLAASIVRLLKNPEQGRRLAEAACSAVQEKFGPDRTIAPLEAIYDELQYRRGSVRQPKDGKGLHGRGSHDPDQSR